MVRYFLNSSIEKEGIPILDFERDLLNFNTNIAEDTSFSFQRSSTNTLDFFPSSLLKETNNFFLIDSLFFIEAGNFECDECLYGFNKETELIMSNTLKRFNSPKIKFSPIEIDFILKKNLLKGMAGFNLLFQEEGDFWFFLENNKKILVKNPSLPSKRQIENYFNSLVSVPTYITNAFSELLAKSLDVYDVCPKCHHKSSNHEYELFWKLSYFDRSSSQVKIIFFTNINASDKETIVSFLENH